MSRFIALKPAPEFGLPPDTLLQLLKYLYGLPESGDAWGMKLKTLIMNVMKMTQTTGDGALYILPGIIGDHPSTKKVRFEEDKKDDILMEQQESDHGQASSSVNAENGGCRGLLGTYVDDLIETGDEEFHKQSDELDKSIKMKDAVEPPASFAGLQIEDSAGGGRLIHQTDYINGIDVIPLNSTYETYRSQRHKLAWLAASRPDFMAASNLFSQTTPATFNVDKIKDMNKVINV